MESKGQTLVHKLDVNMNNINGDLNSSTNNTAKDRRAAFVGTDGKPGSSFTNEIPPNFQLNDQSTKVQELRLTIFKTILKGSSGDVLGILKDVQEEGLSLADSLMLDPTNDMNVLHFALHRGKTNIAEILISNCSTDVLKQVFSKSTGSRTPLHQITALGNVSLVNKVLSRFNDVSEQRELVEKETEFRIEQGRPRSMSSLHLAAFKGFTDVVQIYLNLGVDVNLQSKMGNTALQWAARKGHHATVSYLLDNGANANVVSDSGSTALHWAVRNNHTEIVKILLEKGKADPNHEREIGLCFPIMVASSLGNETVVTDLILHGANVNSIAPGQISSLYHAAKGGHLEVVKSLLLNKADLKCDEKNGNSALLLAASNNHPDIVRELLEHGDDFCHFNHDGQDIWYFALTSSDELLEVVVEHYNSLTVQKKSDVKSPVCIAAKLGRNDKIEKLIELGITPLKTDAKKNTFLHYAALYNQSQVINQYVKYVNIDAKNEDGETALHVACRNGCYLAARNLMDRGAKVSITNENEETVLHVVASSDKASAILAKNVMEHLVNLYDWDTIHAKNAEGKNALQIAASVAKPDVIWELRTVNLNVKDKNGNTPFHAAVRPDCEEAMGIMLDIYDINDRDADINANNKINETVLHLAASEGFKDQVVRLIEYGADIGSQDDDGYTVLHRLVKATIEDSGNDTLYLQIVDSVFNNAVQWWCKRENCSLPNDDKENFIELHQKAVLCLLHDLKDKQCNSVLAFAFRLGADKFLTKILTLENVMMIQVEGRLYYDITAIIPSTRLKVKSHEEAISLSERLRHLRSILFPSSLSNIERLLKFSAKERVPKVLDIPPIKELEDMYTSLCEKVYAFLLIVHIIYMFWFTFVGIFISSKFRDMANGETISATDPFLVLTYVIIPMEPLMLAIYCVVTSYRSIKRNEKRTSIFFLHLITGFVLTSSTITWIILVRIRCFYQDHVLAVCLCIGWIASISLTRGIRTVHFFYRILLNVIAIDISRFLFVFAFFWLGFGFAFHSLIQISDQLTDKYKTPFSTFYLLFNIVVGMYDDFDGDFEDGMAAVGRTAKFAKGLYLMYIVMGTIILLNLLIAMITDSYSRILKDQQISWRMDTVSLGMEIEYLIPKIVPSFSKGFIIKKKIKKNTEKRWYLIEKVAAVSKMTPVSRRLTYAMTSLPFSSKRRSLVPSSKGDKSDASKKPDVSSEQFNELQQNLKNTETSLNSNIADLELQIQQLKTKLDAQERTSNMVLEILQDIRQQCKKK